MVLQRVLELLQPATGSSIGRSLEGQGARRVVGPEHEHFDPMPDVGVHGLQGAAHFGELQVFQVTGFQCGIPPEEAVLR